jgi:biopolymer transport protein TolR
MAFYFSKRKLRPAEEEETGELNIVPYLDILMNLIIFMLLSMTGLAAFGILNVNAPSYGGGAAAGAGDPNEKPPLLLTVAISSKGFYLAATGAVLPGAAGAADPAAGMAGEPTIPKLADGQYDYKGLAAKMLEIKTAFPAESKVIVAAQNDVQYEVLVAVMDACRETPGPNFRLLFPDVTLGAF